MVQQPVVSFSVSGRYNFSSICSRLRFLQVICASFLMVLIFLESGNLSYLWFGLYELLCGLFLHHVLRKWFFNLDGRYDLNRMLSEKQTTSKVQYAIASMSACLLSWPIWYFVQLENSLSQWLSLVCSLLNILSSHGLLALEVFEVLTNKNKQ